MRRSGERCDETISVKVPAALKAKVLARAEAKRRDVSEWVRMLLEETLNKLEKHG